MSIKILDVKTSEGMAEAAYYELVGKNMPILIVDEEPVEGAIKIKKKLEELYATSKSQ